jgi:hypothetical protein
MRLEKPTSENPDVGHPASFGLETPLPYRNSKDEIQGSLHYGGKSAASGRDDGFVGGQK